MQNSDSERNLTALFFSALPYRRKFLHFIKENRKKIIVSNAPWKDNHKLIRYFFSSFTIEKAKKKTLDYLQSRKEFSFDFVILWEDPFYPNLLKYIYDPPLVLFGKSSLNIEKGDFYHENPNHFYNWDCISIVGTRKPHFISLKAVDRLIELFSIYRSSQHLVQNMGILQNQQLFLLKNMYLNMQKSTKIATISGFAKGIDYRVHQSSLYFKVPTIAVLGGGMDYISPRTHITLFERAKKEKLYFLFLSEFFPSFKPGKYTFPLRNRIIVGLSAYLFLMQAGKKSGAMISADYAIQENRELFCFDHQDFQKIGGNEGAQQLIEEGANRIHLYL